ncbi:hypothetical protein EG359_17365 [Chryseobacterium joostei]|uniref:Immunity protein 50 n=1 Tax=Chryseobacterium joostei TaxID=112234 RepID=A0A1N7IB54_9FLAO|nr:hypothetical protein [Chryseobacterium joostei]AZB01273.1 hypothetical protein EG359_17365 [Chryseobacterium joostei]SIS34260.1 hypothetical protein SAMN05421768_103672 [Chryseobacterium joostei]
MIAPQELRIGNWIYDDDGILCKIIGFQPFEHSIRCDEEEGCLILIDIYRPDSTISSGWQCDSNTVKPIDLTEEWLIKFGFTRQPWGLVIGKILFKDKNHECKELTLEVGNGFRTTVTYVHQLQNLFHSLTGEELTIKE